jgi:hypothetical protein
VERGVFATNYSKIYDLVIKCYKTSQKIDLFHVQFVVNV